MVTPLSGAPAKRAQQEAREGGAPGERRWTRLHPKSPSSVVPSPAQGLGSLSSGCCRRGTPCISQGGGHTGQTAGRAHPVEEDARQAGREAAPEVEDDEPPPPERGLDERGDRHERVHIRDEVPAGANGMGALTLRYRTLQAAEDAREREA